MLNEIAEHKAKFEKKDAEIQKRIEERKKVEELFEKALNYFSLEKLIEANKAYKNLQKDIQEELQELVDKVKDVFKQDEKTIETRISIILKETSIREYDNLENAEILLEYLSDENKNKKQLIKDLKKARTESDKYKNKYKQIFESLEKAKRLIDADALDEADDLINALKTEDKVYILRKRGEVYAYIHQNGGMSYEELKPVLEKFVNKLELIEASINDDKNAEIDTKELKELTKIFELLNKNKKLRQEISGDIANRFVAIINKHDIQEEEKFKKALLKSGKIKAKPNFLNIVRTVPLHILEKKIKKSVSKYKTIKEENADLARESEKEIEKLSKLNTPILFLARRRIQILKPKLYSGDKLSKLDNKRYQSSVKYASKTLFIYLSNLATDANATKDSKIVDIAIKLWTELFEICGESVTINTSKGSMTAKRTHLIDVYKGFLDKALENKKISEADYYKALGKAGFANNYYAECKQIYESFDRKSDTLYYSKPIKYSDDKVLPNVKSAESDIDNSTKK